MTMRRLKNRKGVTAVLVAILLIPLIGFAALALDVARWEVGANELHTVADAAALAGAQVLQTDPVGAAATAPSAGVMVGERNAALGSPATVDLVDVKPKFYTPSNNTVADATWAAANAVEATSRRNGGQIFSRAFNNSPPMVTRTSVAWIANVNSASCVKPWGLPYKSLYDRIVQMTGISNPELPPPGADRPNLSQRQIDAIEGIPESQRFIIFRPPTYDGQGGNPDSTKALGNLNYNNGMYTAFNFTASNNPASGTTYQANISKCEPLTVDLGYNNTAMLPGSNDIPCLTIYALAGSKQGNNCPKNWTQPNPWASTEPITCAFRAASDAGCYHATATNSNSDTVTVAWVDQVSGNSNGSVLRVLGKIKLQCVFRASGAADKLVGVPTEICRANDGTQLAAGYPRATIVGTIQGISQPKLDASVTLGNVKSDQQRLILVR